MRQLRHASSQGYNVLGRSHENLHGGGNLSSPSIGGGPPMSYSAPSYRREPLRRYASAHALPSGNVQYRHPHHPSTAPVLRISGDFEDMWNRQHANAASSSHQQPVFGRGIIGPPCSACVSVSFWFGSQPPPQCQICFTNLQGTPIHHSSECVLN